MKIVEVLEDGIQRLNRVRHRRHKLPDTLSSKITNTLYNKHIGVKIEGNCILKGVQIQ